MGGSPVTEIPGAAHGYVQAGEVRLHYVQAGPAEGPLVILLHGFPEFFYGWRRQIPALAAAGFRVVAPDMRGYNLSEKPAGWRAYDVAPLAADIAGLVSALGADSADVVGHDWGAAVAYATATFHPEVVRRLAILNVPHFARFLRGLRTVAQLRKSWYMFAFQLPRVPEWAIARNGYSLGKRSLRAGAAKGAFTSHDLERYVEAWSQPGALTAMVNYYRAALRRSPRSTLARLRPIAAPTLVIWGDRDIYLGSELAEPDRRWVPNVQVEHIPEATHWVQHEAAERVNELLIEFLGESPSRSS